MKTGNHLINKFHSLLVSVILASHSNIKLSNWKNANAFIHKNILQQRADWCLWNFRINFQKKWNKPTRRVYVYHMLYKIIISNLRNFLDDKRGLSTYSWKQSHKDTRLSKSLQKARKFLFRKYYFRHRMRMYELR